MHMRIVRWTLAVAMLASVALASAQATVDMRDLTVAEILDRVEQVSIFNAMVEHAGLKDRLASDEGVTVFAPVDAAWLELGEAEITALLDDTERLSNIVLHHVVPDVITAERLIDQLLEDAASRVGDEPEAEAETGAEEPPAADMDAGASEVDVGEAEATAENGISGGEITGGGVAGMEVEDPWRALLHTGVTSVATFTTLQGSELRISSSRVPMGNGDPRIGEGDVLMGVWEPLAALRAQGVDFLAGDADVVSVDIIGSNGVVHLVGSVLVPEAAATDQ